MKKKREIESETREREDLPLLLGPLTLPFARRSLVLGAGPRVPNLGASASLPPHSLSFFLSEGVGAGAPGRHRPPTLSLSLSPSPSLTISSAFKLEP